MDFLARIGKLNVADWFSVYRILAVPLLAILILLDYRTLFAWFLLISLTTDIIDGILARRLKIETEKGTRLDSYGDFLTMIMAVAGLLWFEMDFIREHLLLVITPLILYFLQIGLAVIRYGRPSSFHTYMSKFTFLIQGVFILSLFFFGYIPVLFYLAVITAVIGSVEEIILLYMLPANSSNVKGLYWVFKSRLEKNRQQVGE